ncbi:MAG: hypothetical protein WBB24_03285, partial [Maribacter sp.]
TSILVNHDEWHFIGLKIEDIHWTFMTVMENFLNNFLTLMIDGLVFMMVNEYTHRIIGLKINS